MVSYSVKLIGNKARPQSNGNVSLYLQVIINRKPKPIPLNLSWPIELVDNKAGVIHPRSKQDKDFNDFQLIINNERNKIDEIFKLYRIQDKLLTMELFLEDWANMDRRKDLIVYMHAKIEERYKQKEITKRTRMNHRGTANRLKLFIKSLPFYAVDRKLLARFVAFLTRKGNKDSTIWGRIKDIKTYIHFGKSEGIQVNPDYENFSNSRPESNPVYLEDEEIHDLVRLFNSKNLDPMRHEVLKAFLFSCFASIRLSDVFLANWSWVNSKNEMTFIPWKNRRFKKEVTIPLPGIALSLIPNDRRRGLFFDLPTEQQVNRSLKDIANMIHLSKVLSFKVSRTTFGTHYYRKTKDVVSLQKIMGHSKIETTMIYVRISENDKRTGMDKMSDAFMKVSFVKRMVS